jgi:predicted transcriptional regulator
MNNRPHLSTALAAKIVGAYVQRTHIAPDQLASLISTKLTAPAPRIRPPVAVPITVGTARPSRKLSAPYPLDWSTLCLADHD